MHSVIKKPLKKIFETVTTENYRYHRDHRVYTQWILKNIESVKGKTNPKFIKASNEYAKEVLGWSGYASWLYVYSAMAEKFKEGWIPDNYYGRVVVPARSGKYGSVCDMKPLTNTLYGRNICPDVGCYVNGLFLSVDNKVLHAANIKDVLFSESEKIVFKLMIHIAVREFSFLIGHLLMLIRCAY